MSLEERFAERKKIVVRRGPSADVTQQVREGKKFIVVEGEIDMNSIPRGYSLIDMKHKGNSFKTLVPQSLLYFVANPGEGNAKDALDDLSDFYGDAKDFEDEMISQGGTNVQEVNWATLARGSYETYLINRLAKHKSGERDEHGEPIPEYNPKVLGELNLADDYVVQRVKAIAALSLGKTAEQVNASEMKDVLKHVVVGTKKETIKEKLSKEEFDKVTCWAGSHYELKSEYNKGDVKYEIHREHNRDRREGWKVTTREIEITRPVLDAKIAGLEKEIENYRMKKNGGKIGRHDKALIRQYTNLRYIAKENPNAQLDIMPPAKVSEGDLNE